MKPTSNVADTIGAQRNCVQVEYLCKSSLGDRMAPQPGSLKSENRGELVHCSSTEMVRVSRVLKTLCDGNRTVLQATDEQALLTEMCNVIVSAGYSRAGVGFAVLDSDKSIRWAANSGGAFCMNGVVQHTWADTELGQVAIAVAIRTGEVVVRRDIFKDPAYAGPSMRALRDEAINLGYSAVAAFPMRLEGDAAGALVITATDGAAFDEGEVALLNELAHTLAFGVVSLRAQAQRRDAQAMVARLAYFDQFTALPNRTHLLASLEKELETARAGNRPLALLHLELTRFREFNTTLGYQATDELIGAVSHRLSSGRRQGEILARVGETEFALLIPNCDGPCACQFAQDLFRSMLAPVAVRGLLLNVRACVGVALYPDHGDNAHALMSRANAAIQQVRPLTGGCAMYHGGLEKESRRRLSMLGDLYRAIGRNELALHFQPKVDLATRNVRGVEALLRWQHPSDGFVSTQELITLIEEAGMIGPLTDWVLGAALRQSREWHDAGIDQSIAINLSAHDLYDQTLVDRIQGLLTSKGVAPEWIEFELTEGALMADPAAAWETLAELKKLKVKLLIDDFGTGYSSLSYLQQLPVDAIKIDQSFVMPMADHPGSATIVDSTIDLGHRLGMKVIAEGVESEAVWERLARAGCDLAQGYLISKPMPADQFGKWVRAWT